MRRLRDLLWQQPDVSEGWLGLTELTLTKAGAASVGCELFKSRYTKPARTFTRQRVVAWFWLWRGHAWPVSMRLYLPHRWIRPTSENAGIPDGLRRYRSSGELARDLLTEINLPKSFSRRIVVSEHFSRDWDYLTSVFRTADFAVCRLHPMAPWPIEPNEGWSQQPVAAWELLDRYLHIRRNPAVLRTMAQLRKRCGVAPKRLSKSPDAADKLLRLDRFLFTHVTKEGTGQAFLTNKADSCGDLALTLERFQELEHGANALATMMRQFEGRTWRGVRHHLTLSALALYASTATVPSAG